MMGLKMITATSMLGGKISLLDHRKKKKKKSANLQNRCYQYCGQLILTSRVPRLNKKEDTRMRLTGIQLAKR